MGYRKYYEEKTNKKIPENFEVHHIDGNNKNNHILNLVAIPSSLHRKYHLSKLNINSEFSTTTLPSISNAIYFDTMKDVLNELFSNSGEICRWIAFKEYLLGNGPYVYNYKY